MPRKEFLKLLALVLGGLTMPVHADRSPIKRAPAFFCGPRQPQHAEPAAAVDLIALILLQFLN